MPSTFEIALFNCFINSGSQVGSVDCAEYERNGLGRIFRALQPQWIGLAYGTPPVDFRLLPARTIAAVLVPLARTVPASRPVTEGAHDEALEATIPAADLCAVFMSSSSWPACFSVRLKRGAPSSLRPTYAITRRRGRRRRGRRRRLG